MNAYVSIKIIIVEIQYSEKVKFGKLLFLLMNAITYTWEQCSYEWIMQNLRANKH